ncbi:MAG: hypothetical protein CM15mP65_19740 [Crocinitomicaceae bacterium]|nr:MAG: hypothetical protein CM15mP65_19740 [Crocinitomicaceae bacterium]
MRACLELTVLAPNSSNLQPWEFYWVRTAEKRKINRLLLRATSSIHSTRVSGCSSSTRLLESKPKRMLTLIDEMGEKAPRSVRKYYGKIVPLAYQQGFLSIKGYLKK